MKKERYYETALMCLNGHVITDCLESFPEKYAKYCTQCGEETISKCPHCQENIRGYYHIPGVVVVTSFRPPLFCHNCGKPYPWTERKLKKLSEIIDMDKKLNSSEKQILKETVIDLMRETPSLEMSISLFKRHIKRIGSETWEIMKPLLIEILSEMVKQKLGL